MGEVDNSMITKDRLSEIPRILIDSILEKLDLNEAVRTSILSRKWRYMWSTLPKLVLHIPFFMKIRKESASELVNVVDRILVIHNGPLHKFLFEPPSELSEDQTPNFDLWILILSRKGIKEVTLSYYFIRPYKLPSHIFTCENLTYLNLVGCILNPPPYFHGFRVLNTLILFRVSFSADMGSLISNLLSLDEISFKSCTGVEHMKIIPPNLSRLVLVYTHKFLWKCLNIQHSKLRELHVEISDEDQKDMDEQCKDFNADMLSANFHELGKLQLNGFSVKAIKVTNDEIEQIELDTMEATANSDMLLDRLRSVTLSMFTGLKAQFLFVKLLLSHSPSLEDFVIIPESGMATVDELRTAMQLMGFTRASPLSKIIYTSNGRFF